MIDFKKTIINLHKAFPDKDLDELIKIIECIEEQMGFSPIPNIPIFREPSKNPYEPMKITCSNQCSMV